MRLAAITMEQPALYLLGTGTGIGCIRILPTFERCGGGGQLKNRTNRIRLQRAIDEWTVRVFHGGGDIGRVKRRDACRSENLAAARFQHDHCTLLQIPVRRLLHSLLQICVQRQRDPLWRLHFLGHNYGFLARQKMSQCIHRIRHCCPAAAGTKQLIIRLFQARDAMAATIQIAD